MLIRCTALGRRTTTTLLKSICAVGCKRLLGGAACITMYDMKTSALTIRLDPELDRQLARQAKRTGRSRSAVAREALRRQLALAQFEDLRRRIMPLAEARGYLTDEDVFRDVS
jgi:predicted transcriptional regulator